MMGPVRRLNPLFVEEDLKRRLEGELEREFQDLRWNLRRGLKGGLKRMFIFSSSGARDR